MFLFLDRPPPSVLLFTPVCAYRQLPHAPENPIALLSATEKRAINLTWAQAFDGNSPLIRYILEVSENSECNVPPLAALPWLNSPFSFHLHITRQPHLNALLRATLSTRGPLAWLWLDEIPPNIGIIYPWEQMLIHVSLELK